MNKKLYLRYPDVYLEKEDYGVNFAIDSEWVTERVHPEDIQWISRVFRVPKEVLEIFFDN